MPPAQGLCGENEIFYSANATTKKIKGGKIFLKVQETKFYYLLQFKLNPSILIQNLLLMCPEIPCPFSIFGSQCPSYLLFQRYKPIDQFHRYVMNAFYELGKIWWTQTWFLHSLSLKYHYHEILLFFTLRGLQNLFLFFNLSFALGITFYMSS